MSTKSYMLNPQCLQDHNIQSWRFFIFFCLCPRGTTNSQRLQTQIFEGDMDVSLHILVPKWVRYVSPKSHTQKSCGTCWKKSFSATGFAKIRIQRLVFWQIKKHMRNHWIQNPNGEHMLTCLMNKEIFYKKIKTKVSIFRSNCKSPNLIIFVLKRGCENDWIRW